MFAEVIDYYEEVARSIISERSYCNTCSDFLDAVSILRRQGRVEEVFDSASAPQWAEAYLEFKNNLDELEEMNRAEVEFLESIIARDPRASLDYARRVLHRPFEAGEVAIAQDARASLEYALHVVGDRFFAGEPVIAQHPRAAVKYALSVMHEPWAEAEPAIATDPFAALEYAESVLFGRFEAGEPAINSNKHTRERYAWLVS